MSCWCCGYCATRARKIAVAREYRAETKRQLAADAVHGIRGSPERRGSVGGRRGSAGGRRGSAGDQRSRSTSWVKRRSSSKNADEPRRGSIRNQIKVGVGPARRGSGLTKVFGDSAGLRSASMPHRRNGRRHSIDSPFEISPLSPVVESPAAGRGGGGGARRRVNEPLIVRGGGAAGAARSRRGSMLVLSPTSHAAQKDGKRGSLIQLLGQGVGLAELVSAGVKLEELTRIGFGRQSLTLDRPDGKPQFPLLAELQSCFGVDRRWLADTVGATAADLARSLNTADDYVAVGIDAAWLMVHGLGKQLLLPFRRNGKLTLSDWLSKLGLEKAMVRQLGLKAADFIKIGWDRDSLAAGLKFTAAELDALELADDSVTGYAKSRIDRMSRRRISQDAGREPGYQAERHATSRNAQLR